MPIGKELGIVRTNNIVKSPKSNLEQFETRKIGDEDKTESYNFAPSEVVQLMVNFQPNESTTVYSQPSGKLYIHDHLHIPGLQEMFFEIEPGFYYEFYIRKITTNQLPYPYDTDCVDYYTPGIENITTEKMVYAPLTRQQCYRNCLIEIGIDKCFGKPIGAIVFINIKIITLLRHIRARSAVFQEASVHELHKQFQWRQNTMGTVAQFRAQVGRTKPYVPNVLLHVPAAGVIDL